MLINSSLPSYDVKMMFKDVLFINSKRKQAYEYEFITQNKKELEQLILRVLSKTVGERLYEIRHAAMSVGNEEDIENK